MSNYKDPQKPQNSQKRAQKGCFQAPLKNPQNDHFLGLFSPALFLA